jgi:hypothetical protein
MKSSRALTGAIIVGAVAVASMFAAAPASAATLPAGQKITVIEQGTDQFSTVNPANAAATPVGTVDALIDEYVSGVDVDDAGLGYATANELIDIGEEFVIPFPDGGWIYKADANSGKLSDGKPVFIDLPGEDDPQATECSAIDYSKGVITAICYLYEESEEELYRTAYIGTVDATTSPDYALLTPLTTLSDYEEDNFNYFTAIAISPTVGTIYAFTGYQFGAYTITLDDAEPTFISNTVDAVVGADFDRSGQLWLSVDTTNPASSADFKGGLEFQATTSVYGLATWDIAAAEDTLIATYTTTEPYDVDTVEAITIWGVLAATGSTASPVAPAIVASLILLAGAILAAGTMVLRRRNAEAL